MKKTFAVFGLMLAVAPFALASVAPPVVPEIDGSSAVSALTLLSGALVVFRARRRR